VRPANTLDSATGFAKEDILSGLFTSPPRVETDESKNGLGALQTLHRRVFGRLFPQTVTVVFNEAPATISEDPQLSAKPPDAMQQGTRPVIDTEQAEIYLQRYQELTGYFPFVLLPVNWNLRIMLCDHPFLLLGILSAMSTNDVQKQRSLDTEFRRVLSEKVIVNGEKSLDLLQGILVYLAWLVDR
jgi:hypothetical protein